MILAASVTTIIAVYGALVATIGLIWRVHEWREGHKTALEMYFGLLPVFRSGGPVHLEILEIVNHSDRDVHVTDVGVGIELDGRQVGQVRWPQPPAATIPGKIAPRDTGFTFREHTSSNVPGTRLYGWATTATGISLQSALFPENRLLTYHRFVALSYVLAD